MYVLRVSQPVLHRSAKGIEYAVTTDRFQEAEFHWPLLGNESWKATVASVPLGDGGGNRERPFARNADIGEAANRYALMLFLHFVDCLSGIVCKVIEEAMSYFAFQRIALSAFQPHACHELRISRSHVKLSLFERLIRHYSSKL